MFDLENIILNEINLRHIWIFITERCNLNCDYCFFTDRKGAKTLQFAQILSLLERLPQNKKYNFVISGGEPLLCWNLVKRLIVYIRKSRLNDSIVLQTNMLLLSKVKLKFLKEKNIIIEPGIDGDFFVNFKHRKGITEDKFAKCVANINFMIKNHLIISPTMTVHPEESESVYKNFKKLVSLGLGSIDVHPAFSFNWDKKQTKTFINQYKKIINFERESGKYLICKSYSVPIDVFLDLVIQPDGFVLPNWTFLLFPYNLRKNFFIMRILKNDIEILRNNLLMYLKKLKKFFRTKMTYREFSNFNAHLILKYVKVNRLKKGFLVYKNLCQKIQNIDLFVLTKKDIY